MTNTSLQIFADKYQDNDDTAFVHISLQEKSVIMDSIKSSFSISNINKEQAMEFSTRLKECAAKLEEFAKS